MPPGSPPPDGGTSLPTSVWLRRRLPQRNWRHRAAWSFRRATPISQMATARTWWRSVDSQEQMEQRMSAWHTATRDSHFSVRSKPWCLLSSAYTAWGFMYSADADGRGHLILILFFIFCLAYIYLRAQLERDPESDRLGHPPPPTN